MDEDELVVSRDFEVADCGSDFAEEVENEDGESFPHSHLK